MDWALIVICAVVLLAVPHAITGDGLVRYEALESIIAHGQAPELKYSLVGPLFATPLYLLGRLVGFAKPITGLFNPVLLVLLAWALWRTLRDELAADVRRVLLVILVLASMFPLHVQGFYGETFSTVSVASGVLWLARGYAAPGWSLVLLGAINTPAALLGVVGIALSHARSTRSWLPLLAPLAAFCLTRLEAYVLRGSLFASGYEDDHGMTTALPYAGLPGFSYPFFFGVLSIVLSFGKGLVFFAPGLFLPLPASTPQRVRWIHQTLVAYVIGLVLAYAKWWSWYGGWFWGPRFFLAASVPASLALALNVAAAREASVRRLGAAAVALLLSFWVGVNGLAFQNTGLNVCKDNDFALEAYCHYVPELSVLWHPFVDGGAARPPAVRALAWVAAATWCLAALWIGREVLRLLARRASHAVVQWRTWW